MDAEEPAAALDISAQGALLLGPGERVTRGGEEDDRVVPREAAGREARRVLRLVDAEAVTPAELLDRGDARRDRVVAIPRGLGEHQDPGLVGRRRKQERGEQQPSEHRH